MTLADAVESIINIFSIIQELTKPLVSTIIRLKRFEIQNMAGGIKFIEVRRASRLHVHLRTKCSLLSQIKVT